VHSKYSASKKKTWVKKKKEKESWAQDTNGSKNTKNKNLAGFIW